MRQNFSRYARLRQLALVSATGLTLILATSPSYALPLPLPPSNADGGNGGDAFLGEEGGAGGEFGSSGGNGAGDANGAGGGGGGAQDSASVNGTSGGDGGNGGGDSGQGGFGAGAAGEAGEAPNFVGGGGGGGGGASGAYGALSDSDLTGGNGGAGGAALGDDGNGGGGGGSGGFGAIVKSGVSSTNTSTITGGVGGAGGASDEGGYGGGGGRGGYGIYFDTPDDYALTNSGDISGGAGGAGGAGTAGAGRDGLGGAGIHGEELDIINSGAITGGLSGDGVTRANAIEFSGMTNSLEVRAGSTIIGNVVANGLADTLILGGATDASFDVSKIGAGAQYQGFDLYEKHGSGTWTLLNSTSAMTNWDVWQGMLSIGSDGALGATSSTLKLGGGTLQISSDIVLNAARAISIGGDSGAIDLLSHSMQIDQGITGDGALYVTGDGVNEAVLTLNGNNTYSGDTTIEEATVILGDVDHATAATAGDVYVTSGGLSGVGTVGGNLTNTNGFVAGGARVGMSGFAGTLRVGGDYVQGAGGTYVAYVTPTDSTLLEVTGTASLAGTLAVGLAPGVYTPREYTILTASSVGGAFDSYSASFVDSENTEGADGPDNVIYTENSVVYSVSDLTVDPTNTEVVSTQSNVVVGNSQNANDTLLGALDTLGSSSGGTDTAMYSDGYVRLALADDAALAGLLAPAPESTRTSLWSKVIGSLTSVDTSNGKTGFDSKTGGLLVGADRSLGIGFTAGVAGGYSYTDIEDNFGSSGTVSTGRLAVYGRYQQGIYGVDAVIGYGHDWFDADRGVAGQVASSSHEGDEVNAAIAAHVKLAAGDYVVTPKAGVSYVHLWEDGYTETGAPGFNLNVAAREIDSLRPFISVDVARSFTTAGGTKLTPHVNAGYSREVMDNAPTSSVSVGGGSFLVSGVSPSRDRVSLGAGLDVALNKDVSVQIGYKAVLPTGNLLEQTAEASVVWTF
ncbi:MAG: autotransporter domain-containing protein [Parvibaculum sp.]|nr:autotransporter domain-containing protein [Parvibaculum sp.]